MSQATSPRRQRRHLHFDALIQRARRRFEQLPEQRRCPAFSLAFIELALTCRSSLDRTQGEATN